MKNAFMLVLSSAVLLALRPRLDFCSIVVRQDHSQRASMLDLRNRR